MNQDTTGSFYELFSSIQGEGPLMGQRHVFIRMAGCTVGCPWCDTPGALEIPDSFRIALPSGTGNDAVANPAPVSFVLDRVEKIFKSVSHARVAVTGGEPLNQPAAASCLCRGLVERGMPAMLETAGVDAGALAMIGPIPMLISMDWKLPSLMGMNLTEDHEKFLKTAFDLGYEIVIKIVASSSSETAEIESAARFIAKIDRKIPLVVQPLYGDIAAGETLMAFQQAALAFLDDVRVLVQMHKVLSVR